MFVYAFETLFYIILFTLLKAEVPVKHNIEVLLWFAKLHNASDFVVKIKMHLYGFLSRNYQAWKFSN